MQVCLRWMIISPYLPQPTNSTLDMLTFVNSVKLYKVEACRSTTNYVFV